MMRRLSLVFLLLFSLTHNAHADFFEDIGEGFETFIEDVGEAISGEELYSLTIKTTPGATVKIMNISPKYHKGIKLAPGSYNILVEKKGYVSTQKWIKITDSDLSRYVRLTKAVISTDNNTSSPVENNKLKKNTSFAKVGLDGIPELEGGYLQVDDANYVEMIAKRIYKTKIIRGTISHRLLGRLPDYHYVTNKNGMVLSPLGHFKGITIKGHDKYKNFSLHLLKNKYISKKVGLFENNGSAKKGSTIYVPGKKIAISKKSLGSDTYFFTPKSQLNVGVYVAWTEGLFWLFEVAEGSSIVKGVDNKIYLTKENDQKDMSKFNSAPTELDKNGLPDFDGGYIKTSTSTFIEMESKQIYKTKIVNDVISKARIKRMPYSYYVSNKNGAAISSLDQFNGIAIKGPYKFESLSLHKLVKKDITNKTELIENKGPAKKGNTIYVIGDSFMLRKKSLDRDVYYFTPREKLSSGAYIARIGSTFWIFQLN